MKTDYDNAYTFDNVYGHVVELLKRHPSGEGEDGRIHLDLGCGYGRIAEVIEAEIGRHYVGMDLDSAGVGSLVQRGLEAHQVDLEVDAASLKRAIEALLRGRSVASISLIDVLEHVPRSGPLLGVIREIALQYGALLVLSVPNIAHRDVGFKLAFGRYDVTTAGLLDHTHVHCFTEYGLRDVLAQHGLHVIERNDVRWEHSDQAFPRLHPALADHALLATYLRGLRDGVDGNATGNQLVVACLAGPIEPPEFAALELAREARAPFLSIVTRTQGRRAATLRDVLLSLAAQSCDDFEVVVVGHKLEYDCQLVVERILEDVPEGLRRKIRFIRVNHGNRTAPLNAGFAEARGEYVAILDDDDLPMAHWVETFRDLARSHQGQVLRVVAVKQEFDEVQPKFGLPAVRATGPFQREYPGRFDLLGHLRVNQTPPIALAFPRAAFQDLNIRFDENLTTTEDWDYLMRVALVCGVASSESITCIYRWWTAAESSRSVHSQDEWRNNHNRIFEKLDSQPILMPAGTTRRLREALHHMDWLQAQVATLRAQLGLSVSPNPDDPVQAELAALLNSRSWRISAPLRRLRRMAPGASVPVFPVENMSPAEIREAVRSIRSSTSWRVTAPLRRMGTLISRF